MINSRKILASSLVLIFLLSLAIGAVVIPNAPVVRADGFTSLGLEVSPSGSSFKLGVNQSQTFSAEALNGTAPFTYTWSVNPSGNFTLNVNGVNTQVSNVSALTFEGQNLTLSYPVATEEFVSLTVSVKDVNGFSGATWKPIVVADPYNSPGYKFDASTATASWIIQADTMGWYRAVNGTDGSVNNALTSTNFATTVNSAMLGGGTVKLMDGGFTLNSIMLIPSNTALDLSEKAIINVNFDSGIGNFYTLGAIMNSDPTGGNVNIKIVGGTIDNHQKSACLLMLKNVDGFKIEGTTFTQGITDDSGGINIVASQNGIIAKNTLKNIWITNIIGQSAHVKVVDNFFYNMYDSPVSIGSSDTSITTDILVDGNSMNLFNQAIGFGVDVFGHSSKIKVVNNNINGSFFEGIYVHTNTEETPHYYPNDVNIDGNTVTFARNSRSGIKVEGMANIEQPLFRGISIHENIVSNCSGEACIDIFDTSYLSISHNNLDGNNHASYGIVINSAYYDVLGSKIEDNTISHTGYAIVFISASSRWIYGSVLGNDVSLDNQNLIGKSGAGNAALTISDNFGFRTSDDGYFAINSGTETYINNALIGGATFFDVSFTSASVPDSWNWNTNGGTVHLMVYPLGNYTGYWYAIGDYYHG